MELRAAPVAKAGMLIRRPVGEVYEAFIDPAITSKFWFSHGSARLDAGKPVTWNWAMYGVSSKVAVRQLVPDRKILIDWDAGTEQASIVEWSFSERDGGSTFVEVANSGFLGDADAQVGHAIGSTDGFALVLAGLKAWLEHGIRLNAVGDRHPDMFVNG